MFGVLNSFLYRVRAITQAHFVGPLAEGSTLWVLDFLNDDGSKVEEDPALARGIFSIPAAWRFVFVHEPFWQEFGVRPNYVPSNWETLLLDAKNLLPQVGPAIVLAASALETLILATLEGTRPKHSNSGKLMGMDQ